MPELKSPAPLTASAITASTITANAITANVINATAVIEAALYKPISRNRINEISLKFSVCED